MAKSINLGNGSLLVGLDSFGQVKDLYFHYPGLENHIAQHQVHKIGIFVDEQFSWLDSGRWDIRIENEDATMASMITAKNSELGITLLFNDVVYNEDCVLIRKVTVNNEYERKRKVTMFFNQQYTISQTQTGNTAYYDPYDNTVIHYKGRRVFLSNLSAGKEGIDEYCIGLYGIEGKEGAYKDAEDGKLSGNPIEHGQVDSVISISLLVEEKKSAVCYYWLVAGRSIDKVKKVNEKIRTRGAEDLLETTQNYWRAWLTAPEWDLSELPSDIVKLCNTSLLILRTHIANNGAIIASGDSDMLQFGRDTYAYVWPRDAAYIAMALIDAGDVNTAKKFFSFCNEIVSEKGYFMHKYRPDKALGSSWHPWVDGENAQLPIQEDETAIVLFALKKYYEKTKDVEYIESIYNSFIKKTADFLITYRDEQTGLPKGSYDLWEMYYGISTYTSSSVYGALLAASEFALLLGKKVAYKQYRDAADTIKSAIKKYLKKDNIYTKNLRIGPQSKEYDLTVDFSSVYGLYTFNVFDSTDKSLQTLFSNYVSKLSVKTRIGGFARFEGDVYHHRGGDYPGNPWVITSMWYAEYLLDTAKSESDLGEILTILRWVVSRASSSGILAEQYDPYEGYALSASPLMWSHASFVRCVLRFEQKRKEFLKK